MKRSVIMVMAALVIASLAHAGRQPNVVLIICDDLNDYVTGYGGHSQAKTPRIAKFAKSGVSFKRAYANYPVCAPSRASFMTGIYAHNSGNLHWDPWYENPVLSNSKTMMEHFRDNGYCVVGTGKVMHHFKREVWDQFGSPTDYGPFVFDGKERVSHPSVPKPFADIPNKIDGSFAALDDVPYAEDDDPLSGWIYGDEEDGIKPFVFSRDPTPDERNANWAEQRIAEFSSSEDGKPFFLAVGFVKPHTPMHVAKKYFDLFPLDELELPVVKAGDVEDTHLREIFKPSQHGRRYYRLLGESYPTVEDGLRAFTQAYLACVVSVDDCVGRVIDAVDATALKENTIVVLVSDHGWQMGQKDYLFKSSPYEESTRIPFIVRAPGVTPAGGVASQIVSLIDLYPTLVDLCGLQGDTRKNDQGAPLDGHSFRPLLENPRKKKWDGPDAALSMIWNWGKGKDRKDPDRMHWTIRTDRWRYILWNNGAEELYDHNADPHEWKNLSALPEFQEIKKSLHRRLRVMRADRSAY